MKRFEQAYITSRPGLLLALGAMGSGAALVVTIISKATLGITLALFACFAGLMFILKYSRGGNSDRLDIRARARTGFAAGILATLAYDSLRLALVKLLGLSFSPLGALPIFGHLEDTCSARCRQ